MNKKILMLTGYYYPDSVGGTESYINDLSIVLQTMGYEVIIAFPSIICDEQNYTYNGIKVFKYAANKDTNILTIRGDKKPDNLTEFTNLINKVNPDIVHVHTLNTDFSIHHLQIIRSLDIPTVLTLHVPGYICPRGTFLQWGKVPCDRLQGVAKCSACLLNTKGVPEFIAKLLIKIQNQNISLLYKIPKIGFLLNTKKYVDKWITNMKELLNKVDHVVVPSKWLKDTLEINEIKLENCTLSEHGINKDKNHIYKRNRKNKTIVFSFIGRIDHLKGVHTLIKAFRKLQNKEITLKIYGVTNTDKENIYFDNIKAQAQNDSRIIFAGEITDSNRDYAMSSIDVLVIPSIWFETGPLVLLEAFNYKIPVIGSNLGGIKEKINDFKTGLLFETGNSDDLADKIQTIISNPNLIDEFSKNIPDQKTTVVVAQEMAEIYENLIR